MVGSVVSSIEVTIVLAMSVYDPEEFEEYLDQDFKAYKSLISKSIHLAMVVEDRAWSLDNGRFELLRQHGYYPLWTEIWRLVVQLEVHQNSVRLFGEDIFYKEPGAAYRYVGAWLLETRESTKSNDSLTAGALAELAEDMAGLPCESHSTNASDSFDLRVPTFLIATFDGPEQEPNDNPYQAIARVLFSSASNLCNEAVCQPEELAIVAEGLAEQCDWVFQSIPHDPKVGERAYWPNDCALSYLDKLLVYLPDEEGAFRANSPYGQVASCLAAARF